MVPRLRVGTKQKGLHRGGNCPANATRLLRAQDEDLREEIALLTQVQQGRDLTHRRVLDPKNAWDNATTS